jgi:hypothetical protein
MTTDLLIRSDEIIFIDELEQTKRTTVSNENAIYKVIKSG